MIYSILLAFGVALGVMTIICGLAMATLSAPFGPPPDTKSGLVTASFGTALFLICLVLMIVK